MQKLHIKLEEGQKVWFTSDLHFGHKNVIRFCDRPFEDIKAMNMGLISNWNEVVSDNDIVFVLGDTFWFNDSQTIKRFLSEMNGKDIYLIPGNHCDFDHYYRVDDPRIHLCQDIVVVWLEAENRWPKKKYEIWLCHYPLMTWSHRENGTYQLFGHIHSKPGGRPEGLDQDLPLHWNQMDVGCDYWDYYPVSFENAIKYMEQKKTS
jgi:calcineurin-like phosphoesterase family protein